MAGNAGATHAASRPIADASRTSETAGPGQNRGLEQELPQHLAPARANRQADTDLAGPFGDAHHHHVGDADAADQQTDRGQRDGREEDLQAELVELRDD